MLEKEKKFLDQKGVEYLWSKINMQDYPNNDTLVAIINAIDAGKMDKTTAIPLIEQAIAGQVPVVKSVDENGKPIEWETSELLPKTKEPNKQLVSDSNKVIKWEDRTHYIHREPIVVLPEIYIENKKAAVVTQYTNYEQTFVTGQVYNVIYNGKEYQSTAWYHETMYTTCLGNGGLVSGGGEDSGEPFFFNTSEVPQMSFVYFSRQGNHTISINSGYKETYIPLDDKYLPATVPVINTAQVGEIPIVKEIDENGKPISWEATNFPDHIKTIYIEDNSAYPGGNANILAYDTEKILKGAEIVGFFRGSILNEIPFALRCVGRPQIGLTHVFPKTWRIQSVDGGYIVRVHYGDNYADLLFNSADDSIIVDPDWVAPVEPIPAPATAQVGQTIAVKSIDENNKPTEWETVDSTRTITINIVDGTAISPTIINYYGKYTMTEIVTMLRNTPTYNVIFHRDIKDTSGNTIENVEDRGFLLYKNSSGSYDARIFFGDHICPFILDSVNNTITLDPDWVAPVEMPDTSDAHKYLTTNSEGEKVWEEKLAYTVEEEIIFMAESTYEFSGSSISVRVSGLELGTTYTVRCDNTEYQTTFLPWDETNNTFGTLGNRSLAGQGEDTGEPFYLSLNPALGFGSMSFYTGGSHTISITGTTFTYHQVPQKYIAGMVEGAGKNSVVMNHGTPEQATGIFSFAEGGGTKAVGNFSHAEGGDTIANGPYSHTEGVGTIASNHSQHVQGRYNIEDTDKKYLHIVGNGNYSSDGAELIRSNAHTLDQEGNAWFAGTVKVGGTGQDDENAVEIATKIDVSALQEAIDTLNGTGEGSVRDTVTDAVATIVAQAPEDFDTLKEIADWITNDETGTLNLIERVEKAEANIEALKPLDVQADWKQTDETAMDFIKNKPNEDDAIALAVETGLIDPVTASDGSFYTDKNSVVYSLI